MTHQNTEVKRRELKITAYWLKTYADQHPDRDRAPLEAVLQWMRNEYKNTGEGI